jgi:hypothetical protein
MRLKGGIFADRGVWGCSFSKKKVVSRTIRGECVNNGRVWRSGRLALALLVHRRSIASDACAIYEGT